jgi:hypothetical protein
VKAIPNPMLAKPAAMPRRPASYAYEPKWDGFRAMLRTEHGLRVLSRPTLTGTMEELADKGWSILEVGCDVRARAVTRRARAEDHN